MLKIFIKYFVIEIKKLICSLFSFSKLTSCKKIKKFFNKFKLSPSLSNKHCSSLNIKQQINSKLLFMSLKIFSLFSSDFKLSF